ncbi:hypothetical protein N7540_011878 [Penicillium herquei]|nr:hypothetical protein N7540_011878 [Penicillium herquei]
MNAFYENLLQHDCFDWNEEIDDDEDQHEVMEMTEYSGNKAPERSPGKFHYQENSSDGSYEGSDTGQYHSYACICQTQQSQYCVLCVERVIDVEFSWRKFSTERDDEIHHYNVHGEPVYAQSTTSPEESLVIILSTPKNGFGLREIYVLRLRGAALMEAAKGRVYKHYSPHGTWVLAYVIKDEIVLDDGDQQRARG